MSRNEIKSRTRGATTVLPGVFGCQRLVLVSAPIAVGGLSSLDKPSVSDPTLHSTPNFSHNVQIFPVSNWSVT
eukprot:5314664-Amphidinium_carterae.1